ncbi:hypothetical protein [Micromonospora sp. LOL_023]|uniref:hypothetical protein n=1 Tax=Micromonospora sp. LOL_023 TaxID=3345418 RepID=UPI003A864100
MSVGEVGTVLQAVAKTLEQHRRHINGVTEALYRSRDQFHAATAVSSHQLVTAPALFRLESLCAG